MADKTQFKLGDVVTLTNCPTKEILIIRDPQRMLTDLRSCQSDRDVTSTMATLIMVRSQIEPGCGAGL